MVGKAKENFFFRKGIKPWKGPLPKIDVPSTWTLGDCVVSDQCSDRGTESMMKLNSLVARMEARSTNFDSNFESDWEHKLQRAGPIVRLGKAGFVKVGTHSLFRCCEGLGHLIK